MQAPQSTPAGDFQALLRLPVALSFAALALGGAMAAGMPVLSPVPYLLALAAAFLSAASSLFAAYYDRASAARERPYAPPPEGQAAPSALWTWAWALLALGILLSWTGGRTALLVGVGLALALVLYGAGLKDIWGPGFLVFGAAQGVAFLLGLSVSQAAIGGYAIAALPVALYGVSWELLRAARQPGAPPSTGFVALLHLVLSVSALLFFTMLRFAYPVDSLPFLVVLLVLTFPRFVRAVLQPQPVAVLETVQYGVLGTVMLAADLAGGLSGIGPGILTALLAAPTYQALKEWPVPLITRPR